MQTKKYSLASTTWDENEYKAMQNVIDSKIFTMGKKVIEFEEKFSKRFDSKYSVMVNSGSSANLLMIAALFYTKNPKLKLNKGDEVIVPSVSWSTTYYPLLQYGLKLKFVDVDLDTLNFDIESLKTAVSEKTRVIFMVNLLGNSNEMTEINDIISDKNIVKLLDNCESMGSKYQHKESSSNALMSSFSTFFSHHISTMEGGVITTNNLEIYHILLSLRAHGWTRNLPNENEVTGTKNPDPFIESFNFVLPGFNVRPMELSGAIGIEQLKKFDDLLLMRRKNAELFVEMFKDIKGEIPAAKIEQYYNKKDTYYVNVGTHGFYLLGAKNPLKLSGIPRFSKSAKATYRARVQYKGKDNYQFTFEMQFSIPSAKKSPYNIAPVKAKNNVAIDKLELNWFKK